MLAGSRIRFLSRDECFGLLRTTGVGRVAVNRDGVPHVVPVNYRVFEESVVFRCGTGIKLSAAVLGRPMSFEVDRIDEATASGWSVLVTGSAHVVRDEETVAAVDALDLRCFDPSGKHAIVQLDALLVSGREIRPASPSDDVVGVRRRC